MSRPTFLIIGAQKAGTTWLAHNLAEHPQIHLPAEELHFFDKADRFARGQTWYERQFAPATGACRVGEKTPDYLWSEDSGAEGHTPGIAARIHAMYPDMKLICILRDPVTRAVSAARHLIQTGRVSPAISLDALLVGEAAGLAEPHGVLDQGFYARHLREYQRYFSPEQLCIVFYEDDLQANPLATLQQMCTFLAVDADHAFADRARRINAHATSRLGLSLGHTLPALRPWIRAVDRRWRRPYRPAVSAATVAHLRAVYAPANAELFAMLGRSATRWQPT